MSKKKSSFSFVGLLASFGALFMLLPLAQHYAFAELFIKTSLSIVILFCVYSIAEKRIHLITCLLLALPSIFISWNSYLDNNFLAQILRFSFSISSKDI